MKELLLEYVKKGNAEEINNFTGYPVVTDKGRYIWEDRDGGLFLVSSTPKAFFFGANGEIHKLSAVYIPQDWENHVELYNTIPDSIRIDIPVSHEFIEDNGTRYSYSIVKRPNGQPGISFWHDIMNDAVDAAYINQFIEEVYEIMCTIKALGKDYPAVGFSLDKRMRDDVGYFWHDFKMWYTTLDACVAKTLLMFKEYMYILGKLSLPSLNGVDMTTFYETASNRWKSI